MVCVSAPGSWGVHCAARLCLPCRMERRTGRLSAAKCVQEKMCIDFFFLIKEHKAVRNNWSSLLHFTFHTGQRAQPPPASKRQEGEPCGAAPGVRGHHGVGVHCGGGGRHAQHPGLQMPPLPPASNLPLPTDVSSSVLERKEPSVLFTF